MKSPKCIKRNYKSGFSAEVIFKPHFNQKFFGIIVDFGSSDPQKLPGTAHFLEHKLFDKKDGDISKQFEQLGADVNAFTSYNETMFYCSGVNNDLKLVKLLFRLVGEPHFNQKNVQAEKPIIEQELAMYQDNPNWLISNTLMQEMFADSNLGIDVAGSKESIEKISAQELMKVYRANYVASRMHFVLCGDFSEYQSRNLLREIGKLQAKYLNEKQNPLKIKIETGSLRDKVLNSENNSNLFGLGLYLPNFKKVLSSLDLAQIMLEIMLESKLSVMSPWFEKVKSQGLLNNPLQMTVNYTREGNFATIYGISNESEKVISAIKTELAKPLDVSRRTYLDKFLKLKKKEWLAQTVRAQNDISYLSIETAEESLNHENIFENIEKLQGITLEEFITLNSELIKDFNVCSVRLEKGI